MQGVNDAVVHHAVVIKILSETCVYVYMCGGGDVIVYSTLSCVHYDYLMLLLNDLDKLSHDVVTCFGLQSPFLAVGEFIPVSLSPQY